MINVASIRRLLQMQMPDPETGMLEIINASFIADEPAIFGQPNEDWHLREREWYISQSLNVNDIPGPVPTIWQQVASPKGEINSNYGYCIFSKKNGYQYINALEALRTNKHSRQATMIYTRPSMHDDCTRDGMRDFICTNTVQLYIRNGRLDYIVNMRSNDAVLGYKGDFAWHKFVHKMSLRALCEQYPDLTMGTLYWNANSLHVYPRHHHLVFEGKEAA